VFTGMLIAVVVVTVAAVLTPHAWLRARWQDSIARWLVQEACKQLESPPPAQPGPGAEQPK
jgi:hypothetical protein